MKFEKSIIEAEFIERPNRFQALVKIGREIEMVHVCNTGRCAEILIPGTKVYLRYEPGEKRKTRYDLILAKKDDMLINIDSQIPNAVVHEALLNKKIKELISYDIIEREKTYGSSRFDFRLTNSNNGFQYYLEVKGVTLENDGVFMFPDAPTERGRKHVNELIKLRHNLYGAGILFLIQISGGKCFLPNTERDPKFTESLKLAKKSGVDIFAFNSKVGKDFIELDESIDAII